MPNIVTPNLGLLKVRASGLQAQAQKISDDNFDMLDVLIGTKAGVPSPSGNGLLGWNFDPSMVSGGFGPAATVIYLAKIEVPRTITIGNILVHCNVAGNNYTNTQVGLYSSAGTFLAASAVLASGGTNTFGTTGIKTIELTAAQTITGSPTAFVWAAIHAGTNGATAFALKMVNSDLITVNAGCTAALGRWVGQTGHATNPLATIGNLTPASNNLNAGTPPAWFGVAA